MEQDSLLPQIDALLEKSSNKRRAAAKKIRKAKYEPALSAIITALEKEVQNPKAWETQYQMIMAVGEIGKPIALSNLYKLLKNEGLAYMVYLALGDAITRLEVLQNEYTTLKTALKDRNKPIVEGAIRAIALVQATPDKHLIYDILEYVNQPDTQHIQFWVAAGAADWKDEKVKKFLNECLKSNSSDTVKAAKASLKSKYLKWNPL